MDTFLGFIRTVGGFAASFLALLLAIYAIPRSPLRRAVERWLDRRIDHRFNRELEHYRHQLAMDAERIRTEHQRQLHNAALVIERKHEVFRELFRLMHIAAGHVGALFGYREQPSFVDHNLEDMDSYLGTLQIPSAVKQTILKLWPSDRKRAITELNHVRRQIEISDAERQQAKAWNYYLANSLYLPDAIYEKASQAFISMRDVIASAKLPIGTPRESNVRHRQDVSDRIEELRTILRGELHVVDEPTSPPTAGGST